MATTSKFYDVDLLPQSGVAPTLTLYGPSGTYGVVLQAPTGLSANMTLGLPTGPGNSGEVLTSNGSGQLYWSSATGPTGPTGSTGANPTGPTGPSSLNTPFLTYTKTSDQSVTSSTTLVDDTYLTTGATTLSTGQYWIYFNLLMTRGDTTAAPVIKAALSASSYGYLNGGRYTSAAQGSPVIADGSTTLTFTVDPNAGVPMPFGLIATLSVPAASSTAVTFKWAQNASVSTPLTVMAGSQMLIYKTA